MKFIPVLYMLLFSLMMHAQNTIELEKKRAIYFEIGGSGGVGSFNFEKWFYRKESAQLTWRAGLSLAPIDRNNGTGIVCPLMLNGLIGNSMHKLEVGIGQGITITTKGQFFSLSTAAIGYRYQPETSKWFYRITYTPLISYLVDFQVQHWGGISFGYNINCKTK